MKNKIDEKGPASIRLQGEAGQALITIIFIMVVSISILTSIILIVFNNITGGSNLEQGALAYYSAESGAQNGVLRLLRNPSYSGETLSINGGTVTIEVIGGVITSEAHIDNSIRKVEVQTVYNNNVLTITSWKEIN